MKQWLVAVLALTAVACGESAEENNKPPIIIINNGTSNNVTPNGTPNNITPNGTPNNVTPNGTPNNTPVSPDVYPVVALLRLGPAVADDVDSLLWNTVEAVWFASESAGATTFTGTITQQGQNFTYSAGPNDRLVVNLAGASFEIVVHAFDGYQNGTWVEFAEANAVDFTISSGNAFRLRIVNNSRYRDDCTDAIYTTCYTWERAISGQANFGGNPVELDLSDNGRTRYSVDGNFAHYETGRTVAGSATTADESVTVQNSYGSELGHNSVSAQESRNFSVTAAGQAQGGGRSFALNDVLVQWEDVTSLNNPGVAPLVNQPDYWIARGTVVRDGATWGTVQFDGPVTPNTPGPGVVLALGDGTTIALFRPIE